MPYKKSYKSKKKKRSVRTVTTIPKYAIGFPDTYRCKLKYIDTYDIATDSTTKLEQYNWRLNSAYDPDFTGIGHQPTYFDELSQIYHKYRVLGAHVKCTIFNKNSSTPVWVNFYNTSQSSGVSEDPESTSQNNNGSPVKLIASEGSQNTYVYQHYYDTAAAFGVSKNQILTNSNYAGTTGGLTSGSDPALVSHLYLNMSSAPTGTVVGTYVTMEITYYCQFERQLAVLES